MYPGLDEALSEFKDEMLFILGISRKLRDKDKAEELSNNLTVCITDFYKECALVSDNVCLELYTDCNQIYFNLSGLVRQDSDLVSLLESHKNLWDMMSDSARDYQRAQLKN